MSNSGRPTGAANAGAKISADGHQGHAKDVTYGKAKICFNSAKGVWVEPGGGMIFAEHKAMAQCKKLAEIMMGKRP